MSAQDPMFQGVIEKLKRDGKWSDSNLVDLADAMSHPEAPITVREIMAREASSVRPGDPAPDFRLPRLEADQDTQVCLSDHFGKRPVALIFGSYT